MTCFFKNMQIKIKPSVFKMLSIIRISSDLVQTILSADFCRSLYRLECGLPLLFIWILPAPYWSVSHSASLEWWLFPCLSLPRVRITVVCHHTWLPLRFFRNEFWRLFLPPLVLRLIDPSITWGCVFARNLPVTFQLPSQLAGGPLEACVPAANSITGCLGCPLCIWPCCGILCEMD